MEPSRSHPDVDRYIAGFPADVRSILDDIRAVIRRAAPEAVETWADAHALVARMRALTGLEPKMWGPSIIGFGQYLYVYAGAPGQDDMLARLGKFMKSVSCIYVNRLSDIEAWQRKPTIVLKRDRQ